MPLLPYSPKLKQAAEEIKEILRRHDIAAAVSLHTPGYAEYILHVDPTYSCCSFHPGTGHLRINSQGVSPAEKRKVLTDSANMLATLTETTGSVCLALMALSEKVDAHTEAKHLPGRHTDHREIGN